MAVAVAKENRILDTLMSALALIGTSVNWNIQSLALMEGIPSDTISPADTPAIYVALSSTEIDPQSTGNRHSWRSRYSMYLCAVDLRTVNNLKADVLRALYQSEAMFTATHEQPMFPESYSVRTELTDAGIFVGQVTAFIDYSTSHTDP